MENKQTPELNCHHCGVPLDVHGTCCGWRNANHSVDLNNVIIDKRHPGFGKKLMGWYESIIPEYPLIIESANGQTRISIEQYAALQAEVERLKAENSELVEALKEIMSLATTRNNEDEIHLTSRAAIAKYEAAVLFREGKEPTK